VLIWFTKLPPAGAGRFQVQIFNITVRGTVSSRLAGQPQPAPTQERRTRAEMTSKLLQRGRIYPKSYNRTIPRSAG
jgi:hypothetical protein